VTAILQTNHAEHIQFLLRQLLPSTEDNAPNAQDIMHMMNAAPPQAPRDSFFSSSLLITTSIVILLATVMLMIQFLGTDEDNECQNDNIRNFGL